jgi:hypothetical protein
MLAGGSRQGGRDSDAACTNPTMLEFVDVSVCRQASWGTPVIICWRVGVLGLPHVLPAVLQASFGHSCVLVSLSDVMRCVR